ncbi:MAG: baseplate J/gp47 family protein, partial [Kineosporiaceae bacterium]
AGRVSGVKAGDRLVLADSRFAGTDDNDNWSLVTVTALTPAADPGTGVVNTQVTFSASGWGPTPTPAAPAGSPSPLPSPSPAPRPGSPAQATCYRLMRPTAAAALYNAAALDAPASEQAVVQGPGSTPLTVHLSAAVRAISSGDTVLFDRGASSPSALAVVTGTSEALYTVPYPVPTGVSSPNPPDIVIAHTALGLALATMDSYALLDANSPNTVGSVAVRYGFKEVGTIIGVPAARLTNLPANVGVPTTYTPPPLGTTAFLQDTTGAGLLVTVSGTADGAGPGQVTLTGAGTPPSAITTALAVPLKLLLDVVAVSRGTTVTGEVLGSGNAALASQSFTLSKSPLTYLPSGSGWTSTLAAYVDGVRWQEVPSFYGQAANARVFVVSRSPDQTVTTVTFGDGVNGARLRSGTGNVVATYRYGSGSASPPAGRLTTISQPQPNLASIQNPVAVSGGADPQAPEDVRAGAPASVFTFGRAISATDYEAVASQAPGVSRVAAYWTFDGARQRALVTVYVGDGQAAAGAASAALAGAGDPDRPVSVAGANPIELGLSCTLVVAAGKQVPAVVTAATAAVSDPAGGLFSPGRMGIGQRLYRSAVDAALGVPGVVAVHDLEVTWAERVLDDVFDPGEGSFFGLPPDNVTIVGVNTGG